MRKNKAVSGYPPLRRLLLKLGFGGLIISLAIFLVTGYIWNFLRRSDYFNIKDIIIKGAPEAGLSYLKGKNIFSLRLAEESAYILGAYPDYAKIKLVRVPPSRLFASFSSRQPLAYVKLYKYFAVDREGVFFSLPPGPLQQGLPVIVGLETKIFGPKPGSKYNTREIAVALSIIKEIKANSVLKGCAIRRINASSLANASFVLGVGPTEGIEVRIGQERIKEKVMLLADVLSQEKPGIANIKYIDLRFREPVIKFKDAKQ